MAAVDVAPIVVPDDFTVWAASDLHGQLGAVDRLLAAAGLTDGSDSWIAPDRTALVVTGDCVDRGPDSVGLVRRLVSLRRQAARSGGTVAVLEGNHEAQVLGGLGGEPEILRALMAFGGAATLQSAGLHPDDWTGRDGPEIARLVHEAVPDFLPALWTFAPYARWRDVLLVHGGPVPDQTLEQWGRAAQRLWVRDRFFASADPFPDGASWRSYRDAGITRVVFGHTPVERPTLSHDGHALNLDTWRGNAVTLARLPADGDLGAATFLAEPAEPRAVPDAPVPADEVRRFDEELPAIVDRWLERVGVDHPRPGA